MLNPTWPVLANSVDPNQLASEEANWSGSALFVIKYLNFYQNPRSSNWLEIRSGHGILIYSARQRLSEDTQKMPKSWSLSLQGHQTKEKWGKPLTKQTSNMNKQRRTVAEKAPSNGQSKKYLNVGGGMVEGRGGRGQKQFYSRETSPLILMQVHITSI